MHGPCIAMGGVRRRARVLGARAVLGGGASRLQSQSQSVAVAVAVVHGQAGEQAVHAGDTREEARRRSANAWWRVELLLNQHTLFQTSTLSCKPAHANGKHGAQPCRAPLHIGRRAAAWRGNARMAGQPNTQAAAPGEGTWGWRCTAPWYTSMSA